MCGYFELTYDCCGDKYGYKAYDSTKCPLYKVNNRFCRTGSVHSWIISGKPQIMALTCANCKKAEEADRRAVKIEFEQRVKEEREKRERREQEERQRRREEDEQMVRNEKARRERAREREEKRYGKHWA
jgi:hypothetical protein